MANREDVIKSILEALHNNTSASEVKLMLLKGKSPLGKDLPNEILDILCEDKSKRVRKKALELREKLSNLSTDEEKISNTNEKELQNVIKDIEENNSITIDTTINVEPPTKSGAIRLDKVTC